MKTDNKIFIDIETIPSLYMPSLEDMKVPGNMSKPETIQKWKEENQIEVWKAQALDSMQGRIICIGLGFDGQVECYDNENEEQLINDIELTLLARRDEINEIPVFVGWNITTFDVPWLWRKAIKYNCKGLRRIMPHGNRLLQVDLMKVWADEYKDKVSLDKCAKFLGIEHEGGKGSYVFDWWQKRDFTAINNHCRADVKTTMDIWERIYG